MDPTEAEGQGGTRLAPHSEGRTEPGARIEAISSEATTQPGTEDPIRGAETPEAEALAEMQPLLGGTPDRKEGFAAEAETPTKEILTHNGPTTPQEISTHPGEGTLLKIDTAEAALGRVRETLEEEAERERTTIHQEMAGGDMVNPKEEPTTEPTTDTNKGIDPMTIGTGTVGAKEMTAEDL